MRKIITLVFIGYFLSGCASGPGRPSWVDEPSAVYPNAIYVSAVGGGKDRQTAENNAKGALVSYFKQSINSRITIIDTERQENGSSVSASSDVSLSIEASAAIDTLIGVEIKSAWNDTSWRGTGWWAAAVLEKSGGRERYAAEINKTISEINSLSDISGGVTFDTIKKCRNARELLLKAETYALVLNMLDGPNRQPEVTRLAAKVNDSLDQAMAIPVDVRVTGDIDGRIKAAFTKSFTEQGFKTGSANSRYAMVARINFTPAEQNRYYNTRYTVDAILSDTQTGTELFTFSAADRESHTASQAEANNVAVRGAVRKIEADFPIMLKDYLGL